MRQVLVVVLAWSFAGMAELAAEDLTAPWPAQRKAAIEKKLDQPLHWDPADQEHVTLAELIQFVQEKHGLKIRWDAGALAFFHGEHASKMGLLPVAASQPTYSTAPDASGLLAAPLRPAPSVAPHPYPSAPVNPTPASNQAQPTPPDPYDEPKPTPYPAGPSAYASPPVVAASPELTPAPAPCQTDAPAEVKPDADRSATGAEDLIAPFATAPIAVSAVALEHATVREGLQQLLDALPSSARTTLQTGLPITTRALDLALLVDENSVLITTQLRANAVKETRVYRLGALGDTSPETLVRVITHSVRPWSWRSQVHEIAHQLAATWPKTPLPLPKLEINMEGVKLASSEGAGGPPPASAFPASEEAVAATGQLLAGGAVAAVDSVVAALEILHYGDPPTGVIEVLPGMLVITQSQGAHREIEQLLNALRDED